MANDDTDAPEGKLPWGLRIRDLRKRASLTQEALADRLGTTKGTISKIERSVRPPNFGWIEKLAQALEVTQATLVFDDPLSITARDQVPVIGLVAAGNWREAIQSPDAYISVIGYTPHMFALRVHGDSVDHLAPDGSYVTVDPTDPNLSDGAFYVVQNAEGEATLKRFRRSPDRLEPDSSNPEHQAIYLGADPVTVVGRVRSVIRML